MEGRPSHPRGYPIFRPHWDERPTSLLHCCIDAEEDLDWIRIAKHEGRVIAAYQIELVQNFVYRIVSLVVDEEYRREGLGGWMLLHALGLIESRGGRSVLVEWNRNTSMLERVGFIQDTDSGYKLELDRE